MRRRHLMLGCCGALAAGLFTGLTAHAAGPLRNPCRGPWSASGAGQALVEQAFEGVDAARLVDTHAHLLGTGDAGSGCTIHPSMHQWWRPVEVLRRRAILDASCVAPDAPSIDRAYVERLQVLAADFPAGARWWLFAFEQAYDDAGQPREDWTTFHVPDAYAAQVAAASLQRFAWVASVHPYRPDALARLDAAIAAGAVAVKWLPSAMNIDPRDPRCRPYCERLADAGLPLIVHCGEEKAAPGAGRDDLVNPLLVRHLMAHGTRVIVAHCASLGRAADTDRSSAPWRPAFELFARLMDEREWQGRLFADISAVFQRNRKPEVWQALLRRQDWHHRLLHGSDHPLPGLMPLFSLPALHRAGVLGEVDIEPLSRIREHNPLLFDFVLKRRLRLGSSRLPASLFEGLALSA
jgi:predicted TIM-barrel fold metal-dependent hydrolase